MSLRLIKSFKSFRINESGNFYFDKCWYDANINDILSGSDIYKYVEQLHRNKDDFSEGDLGERIWNNDCYKLLNIPISDIIIDEYELDIDYVDDYINKYKETSNYPPIVLDGDREYNYKNKYSIIDGNHRTNSLNDSGVKLVKAWVSQ